MTRENTSFDFDVDSNDRCFFCLKLVPYELSPSKDLRTLLSSPIQLVPRNSPPLHSLHYLSRYLSIDMGKVFKRNVPTIPSQLLDRVQRSKLKVQLCSGCASINKEFSGLYRQLEKIQLQMASCAELFHRKLLETEGYEDALLFEEWNRSSLDKPQEELIGKQEVVEELRKEAKLKYSQKLSTVSPRVKVQKLSPRQLKVHERIVGENLNLVDEVEIKMEEPFPDNDDDPLEHCEESNPPIDPIADSQGEGVKIIIPEVDKRSSSRRARYIKDCPYIVVRPPGSHQLPLELDLSCDPSTGRPKCPLCSKQFKNYLSFKSHHKSAHGLVRYRCKECGLEFPRGDICTRHHRSVHKPRTEYQFECHNCNKKFPRADHLDKHFRSQCWKMLAGSQSKEMETEKSPSDGEPSEDSRVSEIDISEVKLEAQPQRPVLPIGDGYEYENVEMD